MRKLLFVMSILLAGAFSNPIYANPPKVNVVEQTSLGLLWMQDGAEYKGMVHQAFNAVKREVKEEKGTKGVFVRIDDVLLDNTPYVAWLLENDEKDTSENRKRWYRSLDATAVDGALELMEFLRERDDVEVMLVTSRTRDVLGATVRNLKKAGFIGLTREDMIKDSDLDNYIKSGGDYTVILTNRLNDFSVELDKKGYKERKEFANNNKKEFGEKWIVVPNLLYGEFETSLSKNYKELTDEEKAKIRKETLKDWEGTREFDRNIFDF